MGYHSAIKRNNLLIYTTNWMNLKIILLSEKNPDKKEHILYDYIHITF